MHNKAPKCTLFWQHLAAHWQQLPLFIATVVTKVGHFERMNSEPPPAATKHRSVKLTMCLRCDQLALLDQFCEENELTRSQAVRQAVKAAYRQRVNGHQDQ